MSAPIRAGRKNERKRGRKKERKKEDFFTVKNNFLLLSLSPLLFWLEGVGGVYCFEQNYYAKKIFFPSPWPLFSLQKSLLFLSSFSTFVVWEEKIVEKILCFNSVLRKFFLGVEKSELESPVLVTVSLLVLTLDLGEHQHQHQHQQHKEQITQLLCSGAAGVKGGEIVLGSLVPSPLSFHGASSS